ncbi:uncharacterized protein [Diabrotica undecimpunctata]|uniref:uncharacterized protein n=1 Tax=Diabrotica undecimpunctata TaxID=50387 RepID=UPI003B6428DD
MKLCTNCLRGNHSIEKCASTKGCKYCTRRHNSLLHYSNSRSQTDHQQSHINMNQESESFGNSMNEHNQVNTVQINSMQPSSVVLNSSANHQSEVLLATAVIHIFDQSGNTFEARALLDSGSQSNFITADLCKKLKLDKTCIKIPVSGINEKITHINHSVTTNIKSRVNAYQIESSFLVIDKITETLPRVNLNRNEFTIPENVTLADETFHKPGKIDILLGASIFYDLLCIGQIRLNRFLPILQKTMLGWVITGNVTGTIRCNFIVNNIHDQLKQFWEIENIDNSKCLTKEEEACEKEYQTCFQKNQERQIVVPLLVKDNIQNLGDSLQTALDRFSSLERKLIKNPEYKRLYTDFINEYQDLGHMSLVTAEDLKYPLYYLPHHGVLKSDNTTTKLRVVFDGSAKTTTDLSLNDCLKVGPTIQSDLLSILIRFRFFNIVLAADIEKMYRQILVSENYQNYQRIIWRTNPSEEIQHFKLKTVTYGTASAPFLAIRSLTQVANEIDETDPDVAVVIRNGFYVDDLLYGCCCVFGISYLNKVIINNTTWFYIINLYCPITD